MAHRPRIPSRGNLRLTDLKERQPVATKLLGVKIPARLFDAISTLANELQTTKTEVVVALIYAGLGVKRAKRPR